VWLAITSAVRTFVLPRSAPDRLSRNVFLFMRTIFDLRMKGVKAYKQRDRIMAMYAPCSLLALPAVWLFYVMLGYMGMFWAIDVGSWETVLRFSGSSIFTLGFATPTDTPEILLCFTEAALGLFLVALLISYLPTMYAAFARRETAVTMLEVRAGSPPSPIQMLERFHRIQGMEQLSDVWTIWEAWFADVEESHTSLAALTFFRSPQSHRSWITAAGAVLDAAALTNAVIDIPHNAQADLCIRAGYVALRNIADFFGIAYNPNPQPDDPISVSRAEFDAACAELTSAGLALKSDRELAWKNFVGWRINYDTVLLALAGLTMAPEAPWSSDRATRPRLGPIKIK
ncbi:MAG: hypothetical protein ABI234_12180, partial [Ktedonobacteraceae bacterium]